MATEKKEVNNSDTNRWPHWGTNPYNVMPHISPESKRIGETHQLRPNDVVVLSFPKTGTTWTQNCCEQLRTGAAGYDFEDITIRQPWIEFAYDLGQDLADDQVADPRIFKSHQLLSAVNPGGKYICIVRDPEATLMSWFAFQKAKGRPGYAEYEDANEYIANKGADIFSGACCFGMNIWEMYAEIWSARNDPAVHILVYEALVADGPAYLNHLPMISEFLGVEGADEALFAKVAFLVSRDQMVKHVDAFDDHFITEKGREFGRALKIMEPAAKVRIVDTKGTVLTEKTIEWMEDQWLERMTPLTGHASYDEFAAAIADLTATEEEVEVVEQGIRKSILMRRSSVTLGQMPSLRMRRESLAPHE